MTESEWLTGTDPSAMLAWLARSVRDPDEPSHPNLLSPRKLRLFCCACCRGVWHLLHDERSRHAVEVAERYADGESTERALVDAGMKVMPHPEALWVRRCTWDNPAREPGYTPRHATVRPPGRAGGRPGGRRLR